MNLRERLATESMVLGEGLATESTVLQECSSKTSVCLQEACKINKLLSENRGLSFQSFSEILRISEKVFLETHQNLKQLSESEGTLLRFKNQKWFTFRPN
jgi:cytidylate kinase